VKQTESNTTTEQEPSALTPGMKLFGAAVAVLVVLGTGLVISGTIPLPYQYRSPLAGPGEEQTPLDRLESAQAQAGGTVAPALATSGTESTAEKTEPVVLLTDEADLSAGKSIFATNCVICHGSAGEGLVGPNLTDEYWIHGGSLEAIVQTIKVGNPAKGMVPWEPILSEREILQVASYIRSLQGTNPPNAKAPEGERYVAE
jgi:mono/diheme cytochrome c family protein